MSGNVISFLWKILLVELLNVVIDRRPRERPRLIRRTSNIVAGNSRVRQINLLFYLFIKATGPRCSLLSMSTIAKFYNSFLDFLGHKGKEIIPIRRECFLSLLPLQKIHQHTNTKFVNKFEILFFLSPFPLTKCTHTSHLHAVCFCFKTNTITTTKYFDTL